MPECTVTGEVDFGKGPVEVRCTEEDEGHEQHVCVVMIEPQGEEDG